MIQSSLTADTVVERITLALDHDGSLFHCNRAFYGKVATDGFRLVAASQGRRWNPLVQGHLEPNGVGTDVKITFSWPPWVVFYAIAALFVIPVSGEFSKGISLARSLATGTLALLAMHFMTYFLAFRPGVRDAERLLRDLLGVYD